MPLVVNMYIAVVADWLLKQKKYSGKTITITRPVNILIDACVWISEGLLIVTVKGSFL